MNPAAILTELKMLQLTLSRELGTNPDSGMHTVEPKFLRSIHKTAQKAAEVIEFLEKELRETQDRLAG